MSRHGSVEASRDDSDDEFARTAKKQRLSSPTYDEQFDLSQDVVAAFDEFERKLSQAPPTIPCSQPRASQANTESAKKRRRSQIALALGQKLTETGGSQAETGPFTNNATAEQDSESRSYSQSSDIKSTSHIPASSQASGKQAQMSSSPVGDADQDMSDWFQSTEVPGGSAMFQTAADISTQKSDDEAFEDRWFQSRAPTSDAPVFFQSVRTLMPASDSTFSALPTQASSGFVSASAVRPLLEPDAAPSAEIIDEIKKKGGWMPSEDALAAAAARMKQWEREDTVLDMDLDRGDDSFGAGGDAEQDSPLKQRSNLRQPATSLPSLSQARMGFGTGASSGFAPASRHEDMSTGASSKVPHTPTPAARTFRAPAPRAGSTVGTTPFKHPMLIKPTSVGTHNHSPFNSGLALASTSTSTSTSGFVTPTASSQPSTGFKTPLKAISQPGSSSFATPSSTTFKLKASLPLLGFVTPTSKKTANASTQVMDGGRKPFVSPFKHPLKPGESGRALVYAQSKVSSSSTVSIASPAGGSRSKEKARASYFDMSKPPSRQTLASCGLRPQKYTTEELELMGINVAELVQMTPDMALFYTFHTTSPTPDYIRHTQRRHESLGPAAALDQLKSLGCLLATKDWVENHWGLILWKLAGMVCLDPETEDDPDRKRWCWRELMRQLRYRYEHEINRGKRPILRQIVAQDVSPAVPMVLCISNITWSEEQDVSEDGSPLPAIPTLEVTDGWYRLSAEVDDPLERAIRKGTVRVGSKISVIGCRLQCERKEGGEILEVGKSVSLSIFGNSSQRAPWHAKLGVQKQRCISTLGSLDPFGGLVSTIEIEVTNAFPIAYLEFVVTEDGRKTQGAPVGEKEEAERSDKWEAKRDREAAKLREEYTGQLHRFMQYAEQLERKSQPAFHPSEDDFPPDHIDDLVLELEDAEDGREIIRNLTPIEAGWLARAARDKCRRDEELMPEYIERDLNHTCPPRNVRSFRIIAGRDARTEKHPAQREVQITVWDVMSIRLEEDGEPGKFKVGQRLRVTNLWPCKPGCWMPPRDAGSIAYLNAQKNSTWTLLGSKRPVH